MHRTLVGSPYSVQGTEELSVEGVDGPLDGLAGLPCFHLWSRIEVPLYLSLGKEPFLSVFLFGLALRNVWLALLLGFLKTHLLTSLATSYTSSFWVWFPLALPFLFPASFSSSPLQVLFP